MPFALMEILPRFGWTKSPNAARGERWVDCSLFFVVALLVISSLLLDLPRFAKAFALLVVLMRDMTDFPPPPLLVFVTSVLDGGLLFSMAKPAVLTLPPTYALSSVAALEFFLDEVLRTRCGEASFDRLPLLRRCCCGGVIVVGIVGVGAIRIIVRARCVFAIFWNKHWIDVTPTSTDVTYVVPMLVKHIDL